MSDEDTPVRDKFDKSLDDIEPGRFGKVREGNLVGAVGFAAVEASRPIFEFIPGIKTPGYDITAHSTENKNGFEQHIITVTAASKQIAEFAAQYESAPSNIDYITAETEIANTETIMQRKTYSSYRVTVNVDERGELE